MSEAQRLFDLTKLERAFWDKGLMVAGMDEVGRGPFAGPVVACCVVMPNEPLIEHVNDSKKLSPSVRERLHGELTACALAYSTAFVEPRVVDDIGIVPSVKLAFKNAFNGMGYAVDDVLIDAVKGIDIKARQHSYIRGDSLSYSIAAASIIAKVVRDEYMTKMHESYPQYGFLTNKGYGTAYHIQALLEHGPCPLHRRSFIKKYLV